MDIENLLIKEYESAASDLNALTERQERRVKLVVGTIVAMVALIVKDALPQEAYLILSGLIIISAIEVLILNDKKSRAGARVGTAEWKLTNFCSAKFPNVPIFDNCYQKQMNKGQSRWRKFIDRSPRIVRVLAILGVYSWFSFSGLEALQLSKPLFWIYFGGFIAAAIVVGLISCYHNKFRKRIIHSFQSEYRRNIDFSIDSDSVNEAQSAQFVGIAKEKEVQPPS